MLAEAWSILNKTAGAVRAVSRHFVTEVPQEEKTNLKHINCKKVAALHLHIEKKVTKIIFEFTKRLWTSV